MGGRTVATVRFAQAGGTVTAQPTHFVHADRLGAATLVTADTAGEPKALRATVQEERSYDAFGAPRDPDWRLEDAGYGTELTPAALDVGFTGHDDDRDLGLVNMSGRVYDPALGRFLTADPRFAGATAAQAWNRYSYVFNNPLTNTDPDGHEECADCTFWDEGGWRSGGGGGGVWGPGGPDPSHQGTDNWIHDSEAYDEGGQTAIDPTRNESREIQQGADRYDRDVKEAWAEADYNDKLQEIQEYWARYWAAYDREMARLKAQFGETEPQMHGTQPGIPRPGSAATSPQALACNGDCPVGDGATDAQAPYEGGVCADSGTSRNLDGPPAQSPDAAGDAAQAPAAAATPAAPAPAPSPPPFPMPSLPLKPGDTASVTLGPGTPFRMLGGASAGLTPSITYNPAASYGFNLGLAISAGAYVAGGSAGISAGYSGYYGWNLSVAGRIGPFFFSTGPDATWSSRKGVTVGSSAAVNGISYVGPGITY